jgi:hypothetical protein
MAVRNLEAVQQLSGLAVVDATARRSPGSTQPRAGVGLGIASPPPCDLTMQRLAWAVL